MEAEGDREAVTNFMDLVTTDSDFASGPAFWRNVYKLWLERYAALADLDFQGRMRRVVELFNGSHERRGLSVAFRAAAPKSFARLKVREQLLGTAGHETSEQRFQAARSLDLVRCAVTANCPAAVLAFLVFLRNGRRRADADVELVRIRNHFKREVAVEDTERLYSDVVANVLVNDLVGAGAGARKLTGIIGEVQILLPECLEMKRSVKPIVRIREDLALRRILAAQARAAEERARAETKATEEARQVATSPRER
eukprot:TRINITY_DN501_c0_g1_i4.p2 TRINITY_DN501_c0_g1~~TRINITY_DN501_c0_g1_i4.p2  ORF type:complete len:294 (-),score=71.10 TRINITY_DN501_c0_g1_i4:353-1117(-)